MSWHACATKMQILQNASKSSTDTRPANIQVLYISSSNFQYGSSHPYWKENTEKYISSTDATCLTGNSSWKYPGSISSTRMLSALLWSYWVLKFFWRLCYRKLGTRPLLQTLSRVNLNPISVPAQNDTNFPQSILGLYFKIFLLKFCLKYEYQERKAEQTVVRRYHKICFWQRIDGIENSCE